MSIIFLVELSKVCKNIKLLSLFALLSSRVQQSQPSKFEVFKFRTNSWASGIAPIQVGLSQAGPSLLKNKKTFIMKGQITTTCSRIHHFQVGVSLVSALKISAMN